jgi:hypothetical protein
MSTENPILDALQTSVIVNRKDQLGQIAWTEWRTGLVLFGGTAAQAGDIAILGLNGKLDPSVIPISSSTVSVNGTPVSNPDFNGTTPAAPGGYTNVVWQFDGSGNVSAYYSAGGTPSFSVLTTGINTTATMTVGSGATLIATGTGIIEATELATTGLPVVISSSTPVHAGQLLISQPGNTSAVWADPLVQGLYPIGTLISTPINPVFIGASDGTALQAILVDGSGNLKVAQQGNVAVTQSTSPWVTADQHITQNLNQDGSGNVGVNVENTVAVTGTFFQATQPVSGTVAVSNLPSLSSTLAGSPPVEALNVFVTNPTSSVVTGTVAVSNFPATQPVSGTVTANQGTSPWITQDTAAEASLASIASAVGSYGSPASPVLQVEVMNPTTVTFPSSLPVTQSTSPWVVSGTVTANAGTGTFTVGGTVSISNFPATQPVSGTVTANQGTSPWVTQDAAAEASLASIASAVGSYGSPASPVLRVEVMNPVSGTVTADQGGAWNIGTVTSITDSVTVTGTVAVTQSTSPWVVAGTLSDNNAAPSTNNLGVLPAKAVYNRPGKTQGNLTALSVGLDGGLYVQSREASSLADSIVTGTRNNQVELNFSEPFNASLITNTSNTTGTYTQANGCATYATGVDVAGRATGVSVQAFDYRPGHEWYCYFTASFATGAASSHQRIGPYNTTDGFWIGFEGTTFGITQYQNGVLVGGTANSAPSVARASFNGDPCNGSDNSAFTSLGVPVALNLANINIYRIRGAWFGTAPVVLDVFAPDGVWVTMHTFLFPNTLTTPYAYTTDWNVTIEVENAGNTSNLAITTPCLALGTTDSVDMIAASLTDYSLAALTRSVIAGKEPITGTYMNAAVSAEAALSVSGSGASSLAAATWTASTLLDTSLNIVVNNFNYNTVSVVLVGSGTFGGGQITFQVSVDGTNWVGLIGVNIGTGQAENSAVVTLTAGTTALLFNITGFNYFRAYLTQQISGSPPSGQVVISYVTQSLASPNVSTTITTGTVNVNSNQGTPAAIGNAWPMEITDGTHGPVAVKGPSASAVASDPALVVAISPNNTFNIGGSLSNNTAAPSNQNLGVIPAVANAATPIWTEGYQVLESVDLSGRQRIRGTLTTNSATPVADYLGVLPAVATTAAPSYTTTYQVPLSTDTAGNLRVILNTETTKVIGTVNQGTSPWAVSDTTGNASLASLASAVSAYGSPASPVLQVEVMNPLTVTFTESSIGVTQVTSPWVVNGAVTVSGTATTTPAASTVQGVSGLTGTATSKINSVFVALADNTNATTLGVMGTAVATSVYALPVMAGLQAAVGGTQTTLTGTGTSLNVNLTNSSVAVTQSTSPWVVSDTATATIASAVTNAASPAEPRMRICGAGLAGQADTDVVTIQGIANGVAVPVSIATVKPASTAALATDAALVVTEPGSTTAGACANTAVTSSSSAVLAANTARREVTVVNTDVVVVYLGLGQVPTATTYHVALSPCATAHDGTGGSYISDVWKGAINAIVASTGGHVAVTEMT